ncbi:YhcH/YjgK/YiaL family protein [Mycoplasmopsis glycophila]|uniref:Beta-galactosidase-like protein n=1 Tax=Mycoplasmopsis glycophila TaxID=171285 RepID=A0A449AVF1_9BACT|nr:YhcH/YjgK/YiaL family protein [Mycoplasmopsis glycophila]VEU70514.1 beta-galactosidase-like protein [Mycoplasmopsis glycophila]
MIFDSVKNAKKYKTEYEQLNKALMLLETIDFSSLEKGANIVDENIKIIKRDFEDFYPGITFGEIHNHFVDIHLYGGDSEELIYYENEFKYEKEDILLADEKNDVIFAKTKSLNDFVTLKPGTFALFLPNEFHAPKIKEYNIKNINKYIVKIKL